MRDRDAAPGAGRVMRCVWWRAGHLAGELPPGTRLDVAIEPKINEWNGRETAQFQVVDVREMTA